MKMIEVSAANVEDCSQQEKTVALLDELKMQQFNYVDTAVSSADVSLGCYIISAGNGQIYLYKDGSVEFEDKANAVSAFYKTTPTTNLYQWLG